MSIFGEIVEPVSRTAWEDWDDINAENCDTQLKWQKEIDVPEMIDSFFLFEGKYLSDRINIDSLAKLELLNCISEINIKLYKMKMLNIYICVIKDYNLVLSSEIVELLRDFITKSNHVVAVQTKPISEYYASEPLAEDCAIRIVSTSQDSSNFLEFNFPRLEQPNIISGVAAGVISLREHLNLPGTAIQCYITNCEEYQTAELEKLLQKLNIVSDSIAKFNNVLDSNLYI